jgi:WD40 repeat protein
MSAMLSPSRSRSRFLSSSCMMLSLQLTWGLINVTYAQQEERPAQEALPQQEDVGPPRAISFPVHDPLHAQQPQQARPPQTPQAQQPQQALPEELRVALVIGNSTYKESPLPNPSNDARAMAAKLRELGFAVIEKQNATREDMATASREFGNRLKVGGVGLFYYAGHGVQLNGLNYLLPVDADIQDETELQTRGYDVNEILNKMDAAKNPLNIVILDACRNNPLPRTTRAVARGLATMQQGTGTIVAYATQPGATAADGPAGGNSLYTQQLLQALSQPGLKVEDVFKQVRMEVFRLSSGTQTPWENSSLVGEFYFNRTPGGQPGQTDAGALARMPVPNLAEPRSLSSGTRNFQPSPVLVPRRLLDTYQLSSNVPMPAAMAVALFSLDGGRFALVTKDRQLRVWDTTSSSTLLSQDGFDTPAVSSDGRALIGIAADGSVNIMDLNVTPLAVRTFKGTNAQQAAIAEKARRLLVVNRTGAVNLYDLESTRAVGTANTGKIPGPARLVFSPAGNRALVWGAAESDMLLIDLENGKRVASIDQRGKSTLDVRFSRDGTLLLTSFEGGGSTIYRAADGGTVAKLALGQSSASLNKAEFLSSGKEIIGYVVDSDPKQGVSHRLALWDTAKGKLLSTVTEGTAVTDLRYLAESEQIYFSTSDNAISVFEVNTKATRKVLTDATLAGFSSDGQRALAREGDGMRLYDTRTFTPVARMPSQTSAFLQTSASAVFATVASSGDVSLWDFEKGEPVAQLKGHIDAVEQVVFAPGGKRLASFGKARTAKLWGTPEVQDLEKLKRDEFETSTDYSRRVAEWTSPYTVLVSLGQYDADAETYGVRIGDVTLALPLPRADAKRFSGQREAILTGRLKVFDVKQLQLTDVTLNRLP